MCHGRSSHARDTLMVASDVSRREKSGHLHIYSIGSKLAAEVPEPIVRRDVVLSHVMPHDAVSRPSGKESLEKMSRDIFLLMLQPYQLTHTQRLMTISLQISRHLAALGSLASEVPVVEVSTASTQVRRESQPAQVGDEGVASSLINLAPDVDEPASEASKGDNISSGFDRAAEAEEQWHPDQVEAELDGVEGGAVSRKGDGIGVGAGGADGPGAVGGIAHQAVEESPCWAEDPSWRASGAIFC